MTANEPYCSNCGYVLVNLVESSKCPECGRPLVEVLRRRETVSNAGKRYRSKATVFGLPAIDIAIGPKDGKMRGHARGFIAIGDIATGWVAIGGVARGVVAIGGVAIGGFSIGGLSVGLVTAAGGLALGGAAVGGMAIGGLSTGGGALGVVAQGGAAIGYYAHGGLAVGAHTISTPAAAASTQAQDVFDSLSWFFGAWPAGSLSTFQPFLAAGGAAVIVGLAFTLVGWLADRRSRLRAADEASFTIR